MCLLRGAQMMLNHKAQKAADGARAREFARANELAGQEFDRRLGYANDSDDRTDAWLDRQYADTSGLQDRTFAEMLGQNQAGFDEAMGWGREAFDATTLADMGLVTANRQARLEQQALHDAEQARQRAFQGDADALAQTLPSLIGFGSQQQNAQAASAARFNAGRGAMTPANTPNTAGMDPLVAAAFQQEAGRGTGEALADVGSQAQFAGIGDAFMGAERQIGDFATQIHGLTQQAQLSRSALPDELAVGAAKRNNAQAIRDFSAELAGTRGRQLTQMGANYRDQTTGAISGNAAQLGDALSRFFGNSLQSESNMTQGLIGSSSEFENKRTNLSNYKMGNTTAYSPLGNVLGLVADTADQIGSAMAGGASFKSAATSAATNGMSNWFAPQTTAKGAKG